MKHLRRWLTLSAAMTVIGLGCGSASAQPGPGRGMMGMDPQRMQEMQQEMQKRVLDYFRTQMVVTNDAEWGVIEPRLTKVMRLKMESMLSGMGMMGGMRGFRGFPGMGEPSPEAEALRKAIESNVPTDQLKETLARFREARKRKEAELTKAQEDLRQVLTVRQEAVMVAASMLD